MKEGHYTENVQDSRYIYKIYHIIASASGFNLGSTRVKWGSVGCTTRPTLPLHMFTQMCMVSARTYPLLSVSLVLAWI